MKADSIVMLSEDENVEALLRDAKAQLVIQEGCNTALGFFRHAGRFWCVTHFRGFERPEDNGMSAVGIPESFGLDAAAGLFADMVGFEFETGAALNGGHNELFFHEIPEPCYG